MTIEEMMEAINEMTLIDTLYCDYIYKVYEDENDGRLYEVGYDDDEVVLIAEVTEELEEIETFYEA